MGLVVREAIQADYPDISAVFDETHALHCAALPQIFRDPGEPALSAEAVAAIIANPDAALLLAERDGLIAGLLQLGLASAQDRPTLVPRRYVAIYSLAVRAGQRRSGIGRALMEAAHRWAHERGVDAIELNVWEFNAAARLFYEELGYTTASRKMWISLAGSEV